MYRLETDYAAVEVEAEEDGVLRHRASAGASVWPGSVVAFITAPESVPKDTLRSGSEKLRRPRLRQKQGRRRAEPRPLRHLRRWSHHGREHAPALAAAHATPVNKQREANAQQGVAVTRAVGEVSSTVDPQAD